MSGECKKCEALAQQIEDLGLCAQEIVDRQERLSKDSELLDQAVWAFCDSINDLKKIVGAA